jgi:hypothetical protein
MRIICKICIYIRSALLLQAIAPFIIREATVVILHRGKASNAVNTLNYVYRFSGSFLSAIQLFSRVFCGGLVQEFQALNLHL